MTTSKAASAATAATTITKERIMMILSPAKTLNLKPLPSSIASILETNDELQCSMPSCDVQKTELLAVKVKSKKRSDLSSLLGISAKLTDTVEKYWKEFEINPSNRPDTQTKPSIFMFQGDAYKGLDVGSCQPSSLQYISSNLRIIDPLYGSLRPLDTIQPYRLEMATKGLLSKKDMGSFKNLADWWGESVTTSILNDLQQQQQQDENNNGKENSNNADNEDSSSSPSSSENLIILNLASNEYSAAIHPKLLLPSGIKFISVIFKQEGRVIAIHAKRARGLMVRYMADNNVTSLDGVKLFSQEGYSYSNDQDGHEGILVFNRVKNWKDIENDDDDDEKANDNKKRKAEDQVKTRRKKNVV